MTYLYLNNSKAPLNQVDLRRAVSWATDYQGMVKGILSGNGKQMRGPIPEGMWGFDATAMQYSFDEAKAKAALEKVKDKPASLTFLYSDNDPNWEPIALSTQASLGKIGINVKLEKLANATMRDRVGKGDYDIAIGNWSPDFADPYMFMNYWFESDKKGLPGNRSFYENKEVDSAAGRAENHGPGGTHQRLPAGAKIVIDEAAYVYLFQKNYQLAMNKEVKGFTFNPMLEQVFNIATMSNGFAGGKCMTFWSIVRQRCWGLLLVVAGVCIITFIISHLIPGDPARLLAGDRASDDIVQNIRQQLGLDQPLYVQFGRYVDALAHGDLGTSIRTGRPVAEDLKAFFPATLELAFCSLLLALVIGVPLGILSAVYRNRWLDHPVRLMAMISTTPAFWFGPRVIVLFYGHFANPAGRREAGRLARPAARTSRLFICWTRCWKATARSFSMRCST